MSPEPELRARELLDPASADVSILVGLFNQIFVDSEQTRLVSGADEPLYLPASETEGLCEIRSTRDYFSSALHEISHWCIAGAERRKLVDFGYWYEPDGRTEQQQMAFEKVEIKPQALEWMMTQACGMRFRLSVDNTAQPEIGASETFKKSVVAQVHAYLEGGLPPRADKFISALLGFYCPEQNGLDKACFTKHALD